MPPTPPWPDSRGPIGRPEEGRLTHSIHEEVRRGNAIREYAPNRQMFESWSLFLIPNYDDPYRKPGLVKQLKKSFRNLGDAIGESHCSVWFSTGKQPGEENPQEDYDYERAQSLIASLGLDSSLGPYIVITGKSPNSLASG